jgi:hypothetical protein
LSSAGPTNVGNVGGLPVVRSRKRHSKNRT